MLQEASRRGAEIVQARTDATLADVTAERETKRWRTWLPVPVGDRAARRLFVLCYAGSFLSVVAIGVTQPWALLGLLALPGAVILAWEGVRGHGRPRLERSG